MKSQFFDLVAPEEARQRLLAHITPLTETDTLPAYQAMGRVLAHAMRSPQVLPTFRRSTVDGFAVRAQDTHGASDSLPAYLAMAGEVPMGVISEQVLQQAQAITVHTGGMIPDGADAVVMIEDTQQVGDDEIEVRRTVAAGENVINVGEDINEGDLILPAGHRLREHDIGGLLAVGLTEVEVVARPRVAIFSSGDEVIPPQQEPLPGQVRDINSYTLAALVARMGGQAVLGGILPDDYEAIRARVSAAFKDGANMIVLSAGSSVSVRDNTARVLDALGDPGVLVHGIATRPGKPTILGMAGRVPLIGLPGNPISAFVQFMMIGVPALSALQGAAPRPAEVLRARLTTNVPSMAGREDYVPAKLLPGEDIPRAEPIFFKSNLIFKLV
ncbi:MAG: gephyrin-like molybdotransferase Glp [Anaerolineae bacterium]